MAGTMRQTASQREKRRIPRKHPRVPLVTEVEAVSVGRTENLSAGGLLVVTRETLEPQTHVTVRFTLPPKQRIETTGIVVHSLPQVSMGIRFLELKEADRKAIEEYVRRTGEQGAS